MCGVEGEECGGSPARYGNAEDRTSAVCPAFSGHSIQGGPIERQTAAGIWAMCAIEIEECGGSPARHRNAEDAAVAGCALIIRHSVQRGPAERQIAIGIVV